MLKYFDEMAACTQRMDARPKLSGVPTYPSLLRILFMMAVLCLAPAAFAQICQTGSQDSTCVTMIHSAPQTPPTCSTAAGWTTVAPATWIGSRYTSPACNYAAPPADCSTNGAGWLTTSPSSWTGSAWTSPVCSYIAPPACPSGDSQAAAPSWNGSAWVGQVCDPPPQACDSACQEQNCLSWAESVYQPGGWDLTDLTASTNPASKADGLGGTYGSDYANDCGVVGCLPSSITGQMTFVNAAITAFEGTTSDSYGDTYEGTTALCIYPTTTSSSISSAIVVNTTAQAWSGGN